MNPLEFKNDLIENFFKPVFKEANFKISGVHFTKEEEGFIKIFNVQSSQFNLNLQAGFYLNIGLFFPLAYSFRFKDDEGNEIKVPKNPKITDCQFDFRSTDLINRLGGYNITINTDQSAFKELVVKDIQESILPFFDSIKSLEDCLSVDKKFGYGTTTSFVGLTYASMGNLKRAGEILRTYLKNERIPVEFKTKITNEAIKRNVEL